VTLAPPSAAHSIPILPACASISRLTVGRPSPLPCDFGREKLREDFLADSGGNAGSAVAKRQLTAAVDGFYRHPEHALPCIACAPFTSRLTNTIFKSSGSAMTGRDDPWTSTRTLATAGSSARSVAVLFTRDPRSTSCGRGRGGRAKSRESLTRSLRPSMRAMISFATAASRLLAGNQ
jgi:hypothetical protein